ncbi:uncharacterized protein [Venturia canescens]|uniref:uncharacterized protein n=1 Tax=Venturia canescens TaxID=32260 RepID=UPI001C9C817F|nr:uncharacterized protein LOC122408302 [Venturia canescens]
MLGVKKIITLFLIFVIDNALCDDIFELFRREDPCVALCEKSPQTIVTNEYEKSCCQRGCRFFNLVDLRQGLVAVNTLNSSKDACESSCTEAYQVLQDRSACTSGCDFMAAQKFADLLSILSVFYVEDSNVLLMSLDMPENDVMTDPGLRKELLPGWWDTEGFKLPQTFIKTVPKDADTMGDYGGSSVYYGETKQSVTINDSDWLQCASRHTGIPRWLLGSAIAVGATAAIWLRFIADRDVTEESSPTPSASTLPQKSNLTTKLTIVIPDEVPLHKTPPPKYSEIADVNDVNFKQ